MDENLGDDFLMGTEGHFYGVDSSTEIIEIIEFGSDCCVVKVYDFQGRVLLERNRIPTDQHQTYYRIPNDQLPTSLRAEPKRLRQPTQDDGPDQFGGRPGGAATVHF